MDTNIARFHKDCVVSLGICLVLLISACGPSISNLEKEGDVQGLMVIVSNPRRSLSRRTQAAKALGELGNPIAVEALTQALQDLVQREIDLIESDGYEFNEFESNPINDATAAVVGALGKIGDPRAVDTMSRMLQAYNQVEGGYGYSLSQTPEEIIFHLVTLVGRGDTVAVEPLIQAFLTRPEKYPGIMETSAKALGKIGDGRAVDPLIEFLETASDLDNSSKSEKDTYIAVITALGEIGDGRAVNALIEFLNVASAPKHISEIERDISETTIDALGVLGDIKAIKPLLQIGVKQEKLDEKIVSTIMSFGESAVPPLLEILEDEDIVFGGVASCYLAELVNQNTSEVAEILMESFRRGVRGCISSALEKINENTAIEFFIAYIEASPDEPAKDQIGGIIYAIVALGDIGDMRAESVLLSQLKKRKENLEFGYDRAKIASFALSNLYNNEIYRMVPLLESRNTYQIYFALIAIGNPNTIDALVKALNRYGDQGMAVYFLNSGCGGLESAAKDWAKNHGFKIITAQYQGSGGTSPWGSLP